MLARQSPALASQEKPTKRELLAAARAAIPRFISALDSPEIKEESGFSRNDDFSELSFGTPFTQRLLRLNGGGLGYPVKMSHSLIDTEEWFVPVFSKGKIACLMSVTRNSAVRLHGSRMGMRELARAWQSVLASWPEDRGFNPVLAIDPRRSLFFYQVPEAGDPNLTPLDIRAPDASTAPRLNLSPMPATLDALRE